MSRRTNYHYDDRQDDDDDDDDQIAQLRDKVGLLKTVSIEIGQETREQNKFLARQDSLADSLLGRLSINSDHVKRLARAGHHWIVFYLLAFALFVMIVIYFIIKR